MGLLAQDDSTFVAGSALQPNIIVTLDDTAPHKFFREILKLMQKDEVMRVEVPANQTPPKMLPMDTVWRIKIVKMRKPLRSRSS